MTPDAFNALRKLAIEPPSEAFTGTWSALVWQPDLTKVQSYVVGVVVLNERQRAWRVMTETGRLDCFFRPRTITQDFNWLTSTIRTALQRTEPGAALLFPVANITATPPRFVRGESAESVAEQLFIELVPAAADEVSRKPMRALLDTQKVRSLVHAELKRIANLDYENIVRESSEIIHDRGDHSFDVDLVTVRGVGSVVSVDYQSLASIERHLLRAAQDTQAYCSARKKQARGIFIYDPKDRPEMTVKERKQIRDFVTEECWKLECQGFRVASRETTSDLATEVQEWAAPLLR